MSKKHTNVSIFLIFFLVFLIISEIGATVSWGLIFRVQLEILPAQYAGTPTTVIVGAAVATLYFIALIGVVLRRRWGPIVAGATALFDLVLGSFLFITTLYVVVGAVLLVFVVILACIEYRLLSTAPTSAD